MVKKAPVEGVLDGVVIIDLTQMLAGPYCTMMLADHGADVIKIEPPEGDMSRRLGPYADGDDGQNHSGYFHSINRNKRSVVLDLKSPEGVLIFKRLIQKADAVVENFREGVMERLGLSYETLREINPRLVYAAIRGFGDSRTGKGPYNEWPAFDIVAQAMGGFMSMTGASDLPTKAGPGVGDIVPGLMCAFGVVSAVRRAEHTGEGQFLDVSMYDAMVAFCERMVYRYSFAGEVSVGEGNEHPLVSPFSIYQAADGWIAIACPLDSQWQKLLEIVESDVLSTDERFSTNELRVCNADELRVELTKWTIKQTKAELGEKLGGIVPSGAVNNVEDILNDPQTQVRQMIEEIDLGENGRRLLAGVPIKFSSTPGGVRTAGPNLGGHTEEVLKEFGLN